MIPGFRFLVVGTVLTMSLVIFGLGAAALLRATHQQFASATLLRPVELPIDRAQMPTLAALRSMPEDTSIPAAAEPLAENTNAPAEPSATPAPDPVTTSLQTLASTDPVTSRPEENTLTPSDLALTPPLASTETPADLPNAPAAAIASETASSRIAAAEIDDTPASPRDAPTAPVAPVAVADPPPAASQIAALNATAQAETAPPALQEKLRLAKRKPAVRKKVVRRIAPRARVARPAASTAFPDNGFSQLGFQQQQANPFGNFR